MGSATTGAHERQRECGVYDRQPPNALVLSAIVLSMIVLSETEPRLMNRTASLTCHFISSNASRDPSLWNGASDPS